MNNEELDALVEILASCIEEVRNGVYECRMCDKDISKMPFIHEDGCEYVIVNEWRKKMQK